MDQDQFEQVRDWMKALFFQQEAGLDVYISPSPLSIEDANRSEVKLTTQKVEKVGNVSPSSTNSGSMNASDLSDSGGLSNTSEFGSTRPKAGASGRGSLPQTPQSLKIPGRRAVKSTAEQQAQASEAAAAADSLEELAQAVSRFDGCELKQLAISTVFSRGSGTACLLLLGEAPGAEEDRQGRPFVGRSGRLLDQMLQSIGLVEENVLISNAVYWRPPGNRNPTTREIAVCRPFVHRLIALQKPRLLVLLGAQAAKSVLGEERTTRLGGLSRMRGKRLELELNDPGKNRGNHPIYAGNADEDNPPSPTGTMGDVKKVSVMATFHPAYLLRQPGQKRRAWADLLEIRRILRESA